MTGQEVRPSSSWLRREALGLNWVRPHLHQEWRGRVTFAVWASVPLPVTGGRQQDRCTGGRGGGQLGRCCRGVPPGCRAQSGELLGLLPRHDQDRGKVSGHGDRVTGTIWRGGGVGKKVKRMEGGGKRKEMGWRWGSGDSFWGAEQRRKGRWEIRWWGHGTPRHLLCVRAELMAGGTDVRQLGLHTGLRAKGRSRTPRCKVTWRTWGAGRGRVEPSLEQEGRTAGKTEGAGGPGDGGGAGPGGQSGGMGKGGSPELGKIKVKLVEAWGGVGGEGRGVWEKSGGGGLDQACITRCQQPPRASGTAGLTGGDGEIGPIDGLPHLFAICLCDQLHPAEVHRLVLPPQVWDLEGAGLRRLSPVQGEPVLEMLMDKQRGCVVDELPMEVFPSPGYSHVGILG